MYEADGINLEASLAAMSITLEDIKTSVRFSGYPLQTIIANSLRKEFIVQEEWGYLDSESNLLRTLDVFAERELYSYSDLKGNQRVRPKLNLLIECKRSTHPYVFFLRDESVLGNWIYPDKFPVFTGLASNSVRISTDDDLSIYHLPIIDALGLRSHEFMNVPARLCATFSKCIRTGKKLELTGDEPFNSIVLSLMKSLRHFQIVAEPPKTALYFDCHLTLAVAVIDAPMIGVKVNYESEKIGMIPWVRVIRHQGVNNSSLCNWSDTYAFDVVHKDFFSTYLSEHVMPFTKLFASFAIKHRDELARGRGFISRMRREGFSNFEARLQPVTCSSFFRRFKNFFKERKG